MSNDKPDRDIKLADVAKAIERAEKPGGQIDLITDELNLGGAPEREPQEPEDDASVADDKQDRDVDLAGRTPKVVADIKRMGGIETYLAAQAQKPTPDPVPGETPPADPD